MRRGYLRQIIIQFQRRDYRSPNLFINIRLTMLPSASSCSWWPTLSNSELRPSDFWVTSSWTLLLGFRISVTNAKNLLRSLILILCAKSQIRQRCNKANLIYGRCVRRDRQHLCVCHSSPLPRTAIPGKDWAYIKTSKWPAEVSIVSDVWCQTRVIVSAPEFLATLATRMRWDSDYELQLKG